MSRIKINNTTNPEELDRYLNSPEGQKTIERALKAGSKHNQPGERACIECGSNSDTTGGWTSSKGYYLCDHCALRIAFISISSLVDDQTIDRAFSAAEHEIRRLKKI